MNNITLEQKQIMKERYEDFCNFKNDRRQVTSSIKNSIDLFIQENFKDLTKKLLKKK